MWCGSMQAWLWRYSRCASKQSNKTKKLTVTGKLIRVMAIGGESTGRLYPEWRVRRAVMNQETRYLTGFQAAEHFDWRDPHLLLHCEDLEKPPRLKLKRH